MGNRAVIIPVKHIKRGYKSKVGIYLHWNGGRDSVELFLTYCKMRGFRSPESDNYGIARLTQVISNFIGGDLSIGVDIANRLDCDNYDNGVYLVKNWEIVGRDYFSGNEQEEYNHQKMLTDIDNAQPEEDRLGAEKIEELLRE